MTKRSSSCSGAAVTLFAVFLVSLDFFSIQATPRHEGKVFFFSQSAVKSLGSGSIMNVIAMSAK